MLFKHIFGVSEYNVLGQNIFKPVFTRYLYNPVYIFILGYHAVRAFAVVAEFKYNIYLFVEKMRKRML
jgi:hypothetical protein